MVTTSTSGRSAAFKNIRPDSATGKARARGGFGGLSDRNRCVWLAIQKREVRMRSPCRRQRRRPGRPGTSPPPAGEHTRAAQNDRSDLPTAGHFQQRRKQLIVRVRETRLMRRSCPCAKPIAIALGWVQIRAIHDLGNDCATIGNNIKHILGDDRTPHLEVPCDPCVSPDLTASLVCFRVVHQ